jgi:anti-sigma factor RsiW
MSCSPFDLRDYFFGELPEEDRRQADLHLKSCANCREELAGLRSTQAILLTSADEEIPRRIGFVSDRVYEPSVLRRWWHAFWGSAPKLGFASAAMLSVALVVSAMHRPTPVVTTSAPVMDVAKIQADFQRQMNEAIVKAVAESDARHEQQTAKLLAVASQQFAEKLEAERRIVAYNFDTMAKYATREFKANYFTDGSR